MEKGKYLTYEEIISIIGEIKLEPGFEPMSTDSYNETKIATKIAEFGNPSELIQSAINMSVIGYGNQRYGHYAVKDKIISLESVFSKYNIKIRLAKGTLLKEDEITPQRLIRFYRHIIAQYLVNTKKSSYLFRKYSTRDERFRSTTFRGAEYLENLSFDEANYLLTTIVNMDRALNLNIADRIIRIFEAKGTKYTPLTGA